LHGYIHEVFQCSPITKTPGLGNILPEENSVGRAKKGQGVFLQTLLSSGPRVSSQNWNGKGIPYGQAIACPLGRMLLVEGCPTFRRAGVCFGNIKTKTIKILIEISDVIYAHYITYTNISAEGVSLSQRIEKLRHTSLQIDLLCY